MLQFTAAARFHVFADKFGAPARVLTARLLVAGFVIVGGLHAARRATAEPLRVDNPTADKKVYPEIEEAKQKLVKQDLDGALESLNAAAKAHPELANGRVQMATIYFTSNRPREGRVHLEKAVLEYPDDPDAYLLMADLAMRENQWAAGALLSDKGIALARAFKGNAEKKKDMLKRAYLLAAHAAQQQERWEDARKLLSDLLKGNQDVAAAHYRLGQVLFEQDKQKEAYAELQAAARMDEDIPSPEMTMAQLYDKAKDRPNAEKWMKMAVAADPKKVKTRLEAAQWLLRIGNMAEAKAEAEAALAVEPDSQEALFLAGRIARYSKDYPQAQKYLERSYLESPGAGNVANELALALNEIGEEERKRAVTLAEATYRQQRDAETAATLGWICYRLGRMEDAERVFNALATANQLSPDAIYFLTTFADARNRGETVKPMLEAALKSDVPFAYRADAQKLFDRLNKRPAAKGPVRIKPADENAGDPSSDAAKADSPKAAPAKAPPAKAPPAKAPPAKAEAPKSATP